MHICPKHRLKLSAALLAFSALVTFVLATPRALAQEDTSLPALADSDAFKEYYTIDEGQDSFAPQAHTVASPDISPLGAFSYEKLVAYARTVALSLLRWNYHDQAPGHPPAKYNRKLHFGRWINDPNDNTCFNTRAKVLVRDSLGTVSFKETNRCIVEKGQWNDPYAGEVVEESKQLQIDHMVPLKNAYMSGAWEWNFQTRCVYANYMGNDFHLVTAGGHENMSKGDSTPENYIPPNESYRCEYLENWLKIKLIWKLKMIRGEVEAIRQAIKDSGCDSRRFALSQLELKRQRKLIYENRYNCPDR